MKGIKIIATGSYLPKDIMSNHDLEKIVDTSDEWIQTRTGIKERRIAKQEETTSMLAYKAAKKAIENSNINKDDIDIVIVATFTSNYLTPSIACLLQEQLGLKSTILAFDLNAACSGFVYGLMMANSLLSFNNYRYGLVIGAEVISKIIDYQDRNTCILFGDGAAATIIESQDNSIFQQVHGAIGDDNTLYCKVDNTNKNYLKMNGKQVFKFAGKVVQASIIKLLTDSNLTIEEIDYIICHQANSRIIDYVAKGLKADRNKFYMNIDKYGNTSAASIPLVIDEMNQKGLLHQKDKIILVGFGGGLSYGGILMEW